MIIHRGRVRALWAPGSEAAEAVRSWALSGRTLREMPTMGWEVYLAAEGEGAPVVSSRPRPCPRCSAQAEQVRRQARVAGEGPTRCDPEASFEGFDFQDIEALLWRPAFAWGSRARKVFSGAGRWSQALHDAGVPANDPVEFYGQPLEAEDPKPQHDVRDAAARARFLLEFGAAPGPDKPNAYQFAPPCATHAARQIWNGGTRTFANSEGAARARPRWTGTSSASLPALGRGGRGRRARSSSRRAQPATAGIRSSGTGSA